MKLITREFSSREKVLLLVLSVILLALLYIRFVDQPARMQLERAKADADTLNLELNVV